MSDNPNFLESPQADLPLEAYRLLFQISSEFIDLSSEKIDQTIEGYLKAIMGIVGLDRMMLCRYDPLKKCLYSTHSIVVNGVQPFPTNLIFSAATVDKLCTEEMIYVKNAHLDKGKTYDEQSYKKIINIPIQSAAIFPLNYAGEFVGAFCCGTVSHKFEISETSIQFIKHIADVFSKVLDRQNRDIRLQNAYKEILELKKKLHSENTILRNEIDKSNSPTLIVGRSLPMKKLMQDIETVAPTSASVLVWGETGTGKEVVAAHVHQCSPRCGKRMVVVNCGAIPSNLFESELFGRQKGAYTGANDNMPGKFELANGSTLFLDEVGELPLDAQAKLLRVLQDGEVERLGSQKRTRVDVRVIAATNRDLAQMVRGKTFREDLFFRLNVFPLNIPALRGRREDIPALVWHFVHLFEKEFGKIINNIAPETMRRLQAYSWPGNIRELKNVIARAVISSARETLTVDMPDAPMQDASLALRDVEREHIRKVLESTNWKVGGAGNAAELLGMNRCTLLSRMKKLGITR